MKFRKLEENIYEQGNEVKNIYNRMVETQKTVVIFDEQIKDCCDWITLIIS